MKFIEIIKKNVLAVAALATVIGFSAFKVLNEPESGWYEVEFINPSLSDPNDRNDPSNLEIGNYIGASLPSSGDCQPINSPNDRCAANLDLSNFSGATTPTGMSVATATSSTHNAKVEPSGTGTSDGYAKKDE